MRSRGTNSIMSSKLRWRMGEAWEGSNSTTPGEHKALALWTADCVEHVLRYFEDKYPDEKQPRLAIEAARAWACDEITMTEARDEALSTMQYPGKSNLLRPAKLLVLPDMPPLQPTSMTTQRRQQTMRSRQSPQLQKTMLPSTRKLTGSASSSPRSYNR